MHDNRILVIRPLSKSKLPMAVGSAHAIKPDTIFCRPDKCLAIIVQQELREHSVVSTIEGCGTQSLCNCQNQDCKRLFTPAQMKRRADSRYCSPECQVKAKHQRTYKPKRTPETKIPAALEREASELTLTWSSSSLPVHTLRKDYSPPNYMQTLEYAYSFIGLTCGTPDDECLIGHYCLDIPNASAQAALREYRL